GDRKVDVSGNALVKTLRQANFCPLAAAPAGAVFQPLIERGERKIQQDNKSQLVLKEIVNHARRRIVSAEDFIERKNWSGVQVHLIAEHAVDLMHVAVELFHHVLEAVERGVERGLVAGEVSAHEILECGRVAIVGTPEFADLMKSTVNTGFLA